MHPPHEAPHGVRDFALHLFTITIGLLIALSLEGLVEWRHHRHLVHEADTALRSEIGSNAKGMTAAISDVENQQKELKHDVEVLNVLLRTGKMPDQAKMNITFHLRTFDSVAWKTAQSTGALSYMSYPEAQRYSDIYNTQDELHEAEKQAARDAILSLAPFLNDDEHSPDPTKADAAAMISKIETLQGQLLLVKSLMGSLNREYAAFPS